MTRFELPNDPGQHFMHNPRVIRDIIRRANLNKGETVLEIGAGKGALTPLLAREAGHVIAVEYDAGLIAALQRKTAHCSNVNVVNRDFLQMRLPKSPFVVVSNIPFSITTPILNKLLLPPTGGFQRGVLVMEKGAAKRFTSPFVKDGYVAVWRMFMDIALVKVIPRSCFAPPPKVDAAMVTIRRKAAPLVALKDWRVFRGLADHLLKDPRAPLEWALRGIFTPPQIKRLMQRRGMKRDRPVGFLSVAEWGTIHETMVRYVPRYRWPR